MKRLTVVAAGLGWRLLERVPGHRLAGLAFAPRPSVFPAVTCVAQATLRTGLAPAEHGMWANGVWFEDLKKPLFWEQSARLVRGRRVWERGSRGTVETGLTGLERDLQDLSRVELEASLHVSTRSTRLNPVNQPENPVNPVFSPPASVGLFFWQQSLGEAAEVIISPAPIHKHGGGMVMSCYTKPTELAAELVRRVGSFPLWRYWGPLASPKVGKKCIDYFETATALCDVDEAYLYLPTLDYAAQRNGPDSPQDKAAFAEFTRQLERVADLCQRRGCALTVTGDYEIRPVTRPPVRPNATLRAAGLFRTRPVGRMAYPDFYQSTAFALCDHEFCLLHGPERDRARDILLATGDYEEGSRFEVRGSRFEILGSRSVPSNFEPSASNLAPRTSNLEPCILLAREGSWCEYKWWTDSREAPDYAAHVDIHNKPGFDPTELFFFGRGTVKGTHGRKCEVACGGRV